MTVHKTDAFQAPKFVNVEALQAMQKANLDTFVRAQQVFADATQAIFKLQVAWLNQANGAFKGYASNEAGRPAAEDVLAKMKAVTEHAVETGKAQTEIGLKAQQQVADLVVARVQKNIEETKSLAA